MIKSQTKKKILCKRCEEEIKEESEDFIQCDKCSNSYHSQCSGLSKREFNRLCENDKEAFICQACEPLGGEDGEIKRELKTIKTELKKLEKLEKLDQLTDSIKFMSEKFDELIKDVKDNKKQIVEIKRENAKLRNEVVNLQSSVKYLNDRIVKNDCIISGLKVNNDVNAKDVVVKLSKDVGVEMTESEVEDAYFLPNRNKTQEKKAVVVKFASKKNKDKLMNIKPKLKENENTKNIYINDFLSRETLSLLNYTKSLKAIGYKSVYAKDGKVFCRKTEISRSIVIRSEEHVDQILTEATTNKHWNRRSNVQNRQLLIPSDDEEEDGATIQETWFKKEITQLYSMPGFESVHCCREDGYGGTSLYINSKIRYSVELSTSVNFLDVLSVKFPEYKVENKPLMVTSFYRSQKCGVNDFINSLSEILSLQARNQLIVVGDSNIDLNRDQRSVDYCSMFQSYDCESAHNMITRPETGTCIDHVFSNVSSRLFIDSIECKLSDHNLICCKVKMQANAPGFIETTNTCVDFIKARSILNEILPGNFLPYTATGLTKEVLSSIQHAVQESSNTVRRKTEIRFVLAPWINKELQELILFKEKLLRQRRKVGIGEKVRLNLQLKRLGKVISSSVRICRIRYYAENLKRSENDSRKTWDFLNKVLGRNKTNEIRLSNSQGEQIVCDQEKADLFNNYFLSSICDLKSQIEVKPDDSINLFGTLVRLNNRFLMENIDLQEIKDAILNLKIDKSAGNDNISPRFIQECVEKISPFLKEIFNKMIYSCEYPDILKIHKTVPIPKKANPKSEGDFRPISILSTIDKVFERIIYEKLSNYFECNKLLYDLQFGFRRGCGTEDAVLNVMRYVCQGLDKGYCGVAGIFFDFTKAFDMVDHQILLKKLECYGVQGPELKLFRSYLTNRKQFVQIKDTRSFLGNVCYGVPQGSGLGPLLFAIYLNDLMNMDFVGKLFMFADDVCLFYPYKYDVALKSFMERDSAMLFEFARINGLLINPSKTKVVRFRPHSTAINHEFRVVIDGRAIEETNHVKYLGIVLQSNMSWDLHIDDVKRKIAPAIGILYKLKWKLDERTKLMIYQSLIMSHVNYLASVYGYNSNCNALRSLQFCQNRALKVIYNLPLNYPTNLLFTTAAKDILTIYGIHEYQVLVFVYKCIHKLGHHTINFIQNQTHCNTRNQQNLRIPLCRLEKSKQRIDFTASFKYNNLPQSIKSITRISAYKRACKP
ncbi:uncharacterized protein LOC142235420 [Haematobia irritans]|uniref:uncharacterized protein LOC142235420 n=1 Tax=Haematobia irritans TaxID=7368 RepID=UPI003F50BA2C